MSEYDSKGMGSYAPGSNLKADWDGTIKDISFDKQDQSQNYAAHLLVEADDGDEVEMFAGLGSDWASFDGGKTVEHPKGENRRFNGQTAWSKLITRMFDCCFKVDGLENEMVRRDRQLNGRGAQTSEAFAGLRFHWDIEKDTVRRPKDVVQKNADGSEEKVREWVDEEVERMMPVSYLGVAGGQLHPQTQGTGNAPENKVAESQPASEPTSSSGKGHPAIANLDPKDQAQVKILAKTKEFGDFVDEVMALTLSDGRSMLEVSEVIQALSDENFYFTLRG